MATSHRSVTGAPSTVAEIFESMSYGPAPESDADARRWIAARGADGAHFIGGGWFRAPGGERLDVFEPATGAVLARVAQGSPDDVDRAVAAARAAQPAWEALGGHGRARHLYALARAVQKHARLLAVLEVLDNGKSIRETRDLDVPLVARHFYHHAGWAQLRDAEFPGYGPIGVVGQVIPWNFPLLMLAWKVAPALAAGNTVVLKPAEFTPLTALCFAELAHGAGLPAGVLNVVTGDGRTGAALVANPGIDKVAFTGSTEVGREIRRVTAGSGKRLSLELGGKSPFLVFEDADLDSVVEGVVDAIWFNQGQVCCAGSRLLVQEAVHDRLMDKLRSRMERLRLGAPLDKSVDLGAIVAPVQLERIRALVACGVDEGATRWQPTWAREEARGPGWFYPPTLLTGVSPASTVAQTEIFGPVAVAMPFRTPSEAIALANNTRFGLAASVWTENLNLALDVAPRIKAGVVWVNTTNQFDAAAGFGGYRESGFGREGGREGMYEYLAPHHPPAGSSGLVPAAEPILAPVTDAAADALPPIDRTAKLYVGGRQVRPDSGYTRRILGAGERVVGDVGEGSRKDLRNAVEAAHAAAATWARTSGHARAQILYYVAENLAARAAEFAARLDRMTGRGDGAAEVEASLRRLFTYAAWADKFDGAVHDVPVRAVALAMHEPIGVVGVACPDDAPLLGFVSLTAPLIATGNTVVAIPSERYPLAATDFYGVLDTSDVPGGVLNVVTGARDALALVLAEHDDVDALWYRGSHAGATAVERASAGNLKRTWTAWDEVDWYDVAQGEGRAFLREATHVKNVWVPYGE